MSKSNELIQAAFEEGYRVSEDGQVTAPNGKKVSLRLNKDGYKSFTYGHQYRNKRYPLYVHRLAAFQLFGDSLFQEGIQARHLNNNSSDNSLVNIAIGTRSENAHDSPAETRMRRARHASMKLRKLTDDQVQQLRLDRECGMKYKDLCKKYGISKAQVSYIIRRLSRAEA